MKRKTTFGGRSLDRRERASVAKRLAIATAVVLTLTFVVKQILGDKLKDLRDSIISAQNQFQNQLDQSTISIQILTAQQQLEAIEVKAERSNPHHDYTLSIQQATAEARQVQAQLHADLDSVSQLIDAMPVGTGELRQLRDQVRATVQKGDQQVNKMLDIKPKGDPARWAEAKLAMIMGLVGELPVAVLGDAALQAAHRTKEVIEKLLRICDYVFYVLGLSGLLLGLYAAMTGLKPAAE